MKSRWTLLTLLVFIMNRLGECIRCFECESTENPACGVYFKAYQYEPNYCTEDENAKCGLQRQPKTADGVVHILRACYYLGQWPGMNESDGCHIKDLGYNVSLEFCLCTEDLCNKATLTFSNIFLMILCASFLLPVLRLST